MKAVFKREFRAYFQSPIAYVAIGAFFFVASLLYVIGNLLIGDGDFVNILSNLTFALIVITPILTMRIMSDDRKNGTEVLLVTSPTTTMEVVLGKYLAALCVFLIMVGTSTIFPMITSIYGSPSFAAIFSCYVGFILLGASYLAIGVFASSLTENQIVSALVTLVFIIFMFVIDALVAVIGGWFGTALSWLSLLSRFDPFSLSVLSLTSIFYYITFVAVFLFITMVSMDRRRWKSN
ncbi:MAG: ABC-2 transporter permease [Clostridia bacterium]|nr:ABC-2 transporter permease [Clostridia bacterium]